MHIFHLPLWWYHGLSWGYPLWCSCLPTLACAVCSTIPSSGPTVSFGGPLWLWFGLRFSSSSMMVVSPERAQRCLLAPVNRHTLHHPCLGPSLQGQRPCRYLSKHATRLYFNYSTSFYLHRVPDHIGSPFNSPSRHWHGHPDHSLSSQGIARFYHYP